MKKPRISRRKLRKLAREGRLRDEFDIWVDRHNHKLEFMRTLTGLLNLAVSSIVLLRIFHIL